MKIFTKGGTKSHERLFNLTGQRKKIKYLCSLAVDDYFKGSVKTAAYQHSAMYEALTGTVRVGH